MFSLFVTGCSGSFRGSNGTFTSPNYPNSYEHARTCEWVITVDTGYSVVLTINDFDMENSPNCTYDSLQASLVVLTQICQVLDMETSLVGQTQICQVLDMETSLVVLTQICQVLDMETSLVGQTQTTIT